MATQNVTTTFKVSDMTCAACEQRIEKGLSRKKGIIKVHASFSNGTVAVTYDHSQIQMERIQSMLSDLHYPVTADDPSSRSTRKQWVSFALILVGIIAGYFLLEQTGVFSLFPTVDANTTFPVLFIVGLLTSVHCVAMCGGINISQCAGVGKRDARNQYRRFLPSLQYNGGRVISYTVIGGIVGAIGSVVTPSGYFRGIVAIAASVFMLIMGLNLLGIFPFLRKLVPRMPTLIARKVNSEKVGKGPFLVGLLNGLMPCGPLQAMQLYALSTGSFLLGALSMLLFSLGTVPLMFGLGALSSLLTARFTSVMMKVSAALVILLGLMMLNNGLSLSGLNPLF